MAYQPPYKKMIETVLDRERKAGYSPLMNVFPPKRGCRVCSTVKDGSKYTVTVVGHRIEDRKVYLWSIVTLCSGCMKSEAGPRSEVVKRMLHRLSEGMVDKDQGG